MTRLSFASVFFKSSHLYSVQYLDLFGEEFSQKSIERMDSLIFQKKFLNHSLETCSVESVCIIKHYLGLKESYFYCHSLSLSPIILTPPCVLCLTFCLQCLINSAEGKLSYSALFIIIFLQAVLTMKTVSKHPVNWVMVNWVRCATIYGVWSFRICPRRKGLSKHCGLKLRIPIYVILRKTYFPRLYI